MTAALVRLVLAPEAISHMQDILGFEVLGRITDFQHHALIARLRGDAYLGVIRAVADRVDEQVGQDHTEFIAVGADHQVRGNILDQDPVAALSVYRMLPDLVAELCQLDVLGIAAQ